MKKVMSLHVKVGEYGLQFFWLNLLWLGHVLLGGIIFGFYPATLALVSIIRENYYETTTNNSLLRRFWQKYQGAFIYGNRLNLLFSAVFCLLYIDYRILSQVDFGQVTSWLKVVTFLVASVTLLVLINLFSISSHFEGSLALQLKRSLVLFLGKPLLMVKLFLMIIVNTCLYWLIPGLIPVFGVTLFCYLSFQEISKSSFEQRTNEGTNVHG